VYCLLGVPTWRICKFWTCPDLLIHMELLASHANLTPTPVWDLSWFPQFLQAYERMVRTLNKATTTSSQYFFPVYYSRTSDPSMLYFELLTAPLNKTTKKKSDILEWYYIPFSIYDVNQNRHFGYLIEHTRNVPPKVDCSKYELHSTKFWTKSHCLIFTVSGLLVWNHSTYERIVYSRTKIHIRNIE
jgi:hypothetical protein